MKMWALGCSASLQHEILFTTQADKFPEKLSPILKWFALESSEMDERYKKKCCLAISCNDESH